MVPLDKSQKIISDILTEYVKIPYAYGQLETKLIIDRTATNYIVMTLGWQGEERVHGCIIHIEIIVCMVVQYTSISKMIKFGFSGMEPR